MSEKANIKSFVRDFVDDTKSHIKIDLQFIETIQDFSFYIDFLFPITSYDEKGWATDEEYERHRKIREQFEEKFLEKYELSFLMVSYIPFQWNTIAFIGKNLGNLDNEVKSWITESNLDIQYAIVMGSGMQAYYNEMLPNDFELVNIENEELRYVIFENEIGKSMDEAEDDEIQEVFFKNRIFEHFIYEENEEKVAKIEEFAKENNYECEIIFMDEEEIQDLEGVEKPYYSIALRKNSDLQKIDDETFEIKNFVEEIGSQYDWWECEIFPKE